MNEDPMVLRKLASDLLLDAVETLRRPPPTSRPPKCRVTWRRLWITWAKHRARDIAFFRDERRSGPWCEAAGVEYDAVIQRLEEEGALYDPRTKFPTNSRGRCLIFPPKPPVIPSEPTPKEKQSRRPPDLSSRECSKCGRRCVGRKGLAIHRSKCHGARALKAVDAYREGMPMKEIVWRFGIPEDAMYPLLRDHNVPRRQ